MFASSERVLTDESIGCAEESLRSANITAKDISAIGMGSPGPLNPETGVVLRTGNIALENYPIGQILSKHFGVDGIEPAERLVQQHQLRLGDHRGDELHLLRHALG